MTRRTFTRAEAEHIGLPHDLAPGVELAREQIDTRRWVSIHRLVFTHDGRAWAVEYCQGLTENQEDTDPWEYEDDIEAVEVEMRPQLVQRYVPVGTPAGDDPAEHTRRLLAVIAAAADPLLRHQPNSPAAALATLISRAATGDLSADDAEHDLARELDLFRRATADDARRMFTVVFKGFDHRDPTAVILAAQDPLEARAAAEAAVAAHDPDLIANYVITLEADGPAIFRGEPARTLRPQAVEPDGGRR